MNQNKLRRQSARLTWGGNKQTDVAEPYLEVVEKSSLIYQDKMTNNSYVMYEPHLIESSCLEGSAWKGF